jgi:hypothetical protein
MHQSDYVCGNCGWSQYANRGPPHPTAAKKSHVGGTIGIVILLLMVSGVGYFASENGHTAWIAWNVESTHITETVDVVVYIDGKEVSHYDNLKPKNYFWNTHYYGYAFSFFTESKIIEIKAVSVGGGLGMQTDTEKIIVHNGEEYNVKLYV